MFYRDSFILLSPTGRTFEGETPSSAVRQAVRLRFDDSWSYFTVLGSRGEHRMHGYTDEWTHEEKVRDACRTTVLRHLRRQGWRLLREVR